MGKLKTVNIKELIQSESMLTSKLSVGIQYSDCICDLMKKLSSRCGDTPFFLAHEGHLEFILKTQNGNLY